MKKCRIAGIVVLALALAVAALGFVVEGAKEGDGAFAGKLVSARMQVETVAANGKAVKNLDSLNKKLATAETKLGEAAEKASASLSAMDALDAALLTDETGDADVDALRVALEKLQDGAEAADVYVEYAAEGLSKALESVNAGIEEISALTDAKVLQMYISLADDALDAVNAAENAVGAVSEGAKKVCALVGGESAAAEIAVTEAGERTSIAACRDEVGALIARAEALQAEAAAAPEWVNEARKAVDQAASARVSIGQKLIIALSDNFIGVLFTAALLMVIGLVLIFLAEPFKRRWTNDPVFSVAMALMVMLVLQTYALGFQQGSVGTWAKFWFDNTFNVLRANTSVGMVALGMTLVIIIGGIDLAVGSTLAGVGTVLMAMIDTGDHGVLIRFGITGTPAFAIGIAVALLTGVAIGAVNGLLITKGKVPPFIATLGIMNIIRSVAQYFTKSYSPTVPKAFESIANTMILGQRPMTIVYWLVLAVIFYLLMKYTAFGRYVYATGSNERTTRLSGVNTDKVKMKVYMISGLVVAIAAVAQLSRLGGMDVASAGSGYELDSIAAVVVGGTAMSGGRGSIIGTILGVLIIGLMNNLLILLGVDSFLTDAFKGLIVVAAVLMQRKEKNA